MSGESKTESYNSKVLRGHTRGVNSVSFSPDGSRIVSGSADYTVRVWDSQSGAELMRLNGHTYEVSSVSFSPDGTRIVSGSWDDTVRVWDVASGECVLTLMSSWVESVAFSPDGRRIVSGSGTGQMSVWDASSGELLKVLDGHIQPVGSVSFSPDGSHLVSGSWDNTVRVWDASSWVCVVLIGTPQADPEESEQEDAAWDRGSVLGPLEGHTSWVNSVSFSPDGLRIVSGSGNGSWDNTVRVWDASSGELLKTLEGHTDSVNSVSFSPDGSRIVSGSNDKTMRVWDFDAIEYAILVDELSSSDPLVDELSVLPNPVSVDDDSGSDYSNLFGSDDSDDDERPHHPMVVPPDEICVICMDNLRDTSNGYAVMLTCNHFFHADCIRGWQNAGESKSEGYEEGVTFLQSGYQMKGKKCPICRFTAEDTTYADGILRLRF